MQSNVPSGAACSVEADSGYGAKPEHLVPKNNSVSTGGRSGPPLRGVFIHRQDRQQRVSSSTKPTNVPSGVACSVKAESGYGAKPEHLVPKNNSVSTGGRSGPPLRGVGQHSQHQIPKTSQPTRRGVECGMGVPQGVPKSTKRFKKTKRPPA